MAEAYPMMRVRAERMLRSFRSPVRCPASRTRVFIPAFEFTLLSFAFDRRTASSFALSFAILTCIVRLSVARRRTRARCLHLFSWSDPGSSVFVIPRGRNRLNARFANLRPLWLRCAGAFAGTRVDHRGPRSVGGRRWQRHVRPEPVHCSRTSLDVVAVLWCWPGCGLT